MNQRLVHDTAVVMAKAILDIMKPCIREEEMRDAFSEFYVVCKAGIETFCIQQDRMQQRLLSKWWN
jgi:hypothetical protein